MLAWVRVAGWGLVCAVVVSCASTPNDDALSPEQERESAINRLRTQTQEKPSDEAYYELGNALFDAYRYGEAMQAYRRTLDLNANHAGAYCNIGLSYRKLGDVPRAIEAYHKALAIDPDDATVLRNLIFALDDMGNFPQSVLRLRHLIELEPRDAKLHSDLGRSLLTLERYEEAAKAYGEAITLEPGYISDHYNLGLCFFSMENWNEARDAWLVSLSKDSQNAPTLQGLAVVNWRLGNYDEAWRFVGEGQKLNAPFAPDFISQLQEESGRVGPG